MKVETRIVPQEVPPRFLAQHLKPYETIKGMVENKRVLDIGSGDGYGTFYLAKFAGVAVGVDYDGPTITTAQAKYSLSNLTFIEMDALHLRFDDAVFDVVCSFQNIEHIPEDNLAGYLSEIKRVLVPGGRLVLTTLNLDQARKKNARRPYEKNPAHCKEFTLEELTALVGKYFSLEEKYGLFQTTRHNFFHRLKKSGIFNRLPAAVNPVSRFYQGVTTADFVFRTADLEKASDFLLIGRKGGG